MTKRKKSQKGLEEELHIVKNAGYTATKRTKKDKTVNRRAGLHDKKKDLEGEVRVKRRKPLALKHVRRMRKVGAVVSLAAVAGIAVVGVGFFAPQKVTQLNDEYYTVCYEAPTDGTKPTAYSLVENVGYMNYVLQNQQWWSSEMNSNVIAMGFSQTVETYKQYYNDVLISADVAKGFSSKATQFCVANGIVMWRPSANKNFDKMNTPWSTGDAQAMNIKTYKKNRGFPPSEFSVYVLNELTIANANEYSVVDNGNGTYSMTLKLNVNTGEDKTCAEYYYKLQMKVTGDLYDCPTINSTTVTYTFDESWRILECKISDSYKTPVAKGFSPSCTSETTVVYDYRKENAQNSFWENYFSSQYDKLKDSLSDGDGAEDATPGALGYLSGAFASVLTDGAVFKLDLNLDELNLNGVVCVDMKNNSLSGVTAKLGDILIWLDGNTLYINDGLSKYKLNINDITGSSDGGEEDAAGGFDVAALLDQLIEGEFVYDEETGIATLNSSLELFGLKTSLKFEFLNSVGGVELNFIEAQIPLGDKSVKAKLCFGGEDDKPVIPTDTSNYTDILNDGVAFDIALKLDNETLAGTAKIYTENGAFSGVYAQLDDIVIYYDCSAENSDRPRNMLYLTDGSVKYKLDLNAVSSGDNGSFDFSKILGKADVNSLLSEALSNLTAKGGVIGTGVTVNIEQLKTALGATVALKLEGGLGATVGLTLNGKNLSVSANLTDAPVTLPDFKDYQDVLNSEITLDLSLKLITGGISASDNNVVTLDGTVTICLENGNICEVIADFGGVAVYYEATEKTFYIRIGTTKLTFGIDDWATGAFSIPALISGDTKIVAEDLPRIVVDLINNMVADAKVISTNTSLTIFDAVVPLSVYINLNGGLGVNAETIVFGINAVADVKFGADPVARLSEADKEEYINILEEGEKLLESLTSGHISATVSGSLYSNDGENYAEKYGFTASLEFAMAQPVDDGLTAEEAVAAITSDNSLYIHLSIQLTAKAEGADNLNLDLIIMNANPNAGGTNGMTTGGYTTPDSTLDVYLSLSKLGKGGNPLKIYAPADEILNVVSMLGATLNLKGMTFEDEDLAVAVAQIANVLDGIFISKSLPESVQDKFASLGESLIPQIIGTSLEEMIGNLVAGAADGLDKTQSKKLSPDKNYIQCISTTDTSLKIVLNSSLIYDTPTDGDITVIFSRVLSDGVYFVNGITVNNIFYGENNVNKLDLSMKLGYGEIDKPNSSNGLKGYLNAVGLDTLLNAAVNSATHLTTAEEYAAGEAAQYTLNKDYHLSGNIELSILGINGISPKIRLNGFAVHIGEDNKVSFHANFSYDKTTLTLDESATVDLTVINDMVYLRKTTSSGVTYRIMTSQAFTADIYNQLQYMLSFSNLVMSFMPKDNSAITLPEFNDYGDYLSAFLTGYRFDENALKWSFAINGKTIGDMIGVSMTDITININSELQADGAYLLKSLTLGGKMFSVISFGGTLNYDNPQSLCLDNSLNKTVDLLNDNLLGGTNLYSALGGDNFKDICEATDWQAVTGANGTNYLAYGGNSPVAAGVINLTYSANPDKNTLQGILYNSSACELYSKRNIGVSVSYVSDVPYNGGVNTANAYYKLGEGGELLSATSDVSGNQLIGWFMEVNGTYKYVASYADVTKYILTGGFTAVDDVVSVTLHAVWVNTDAFNVTTSYVNKNGWSTWTFQGEYTFKYAEGESARIAELAGITRNATAKYHISKDGSSIYDTVGNTNKSPKNLGGNFSFNDSGMLSGNGIIGTFYGATEITVTLSVDGHELASFTKTSGYIKQS